MRVTTSCFGRFHIFDQARELERLGVLHQLICAYSRNFVRGWGIPNSKVTSLPANGAAGLAARWIARLLPANVASRMTRAVHDAYSRRVARHLSLKSHVFIGLSSFCLEALVRAKQDGILAVVDHGSLHERSAQRLLHVEADRWHFHPDTQWPYPWVLEKEDQEFREADRILVLSECAKRSFVQEGIAPNKIFVNGCGVDLMRFKPRGKADNVFRVIYCGGITATKGVQYLLQAFWELAFPGAELWLIGGGLTTSPLRSVIQRYLSKQVLFKGPFPQVELAKFYSQGSVFVLPSVADGFGMVVPQAMACGLPVIVSRNAGAADVIDHGKNGFVVPAQDTEAIKDRLLFMYEHPDARDEMARAALETSQRKLGWEHYGQRLVSELQRLLTVHPHADVPRSSSELQRT